MRSAEGGEGGVARRGVLLGPAHWGEAGQVHQLTELARRATAAGWEVFVAEHSRRPDYVPSALAASALILGACPDARVTTAGVVAAVRDPLSLVRDAEVLAEAATSGGSFTLGLVAGYEPDDLPGGRHGRRFADLDAAVALCSPLRRRWGLVVGGAGARAVARACRADGLVLPTWADPVAVAAAAAAVHQAGTGKQVVVMRRWRPSATGSAGGATGRTPAHLVIEGSPGARLAELGVAGADAVALGPVTSPSELDQLLASGATGR